VHFPALPAVSNFVGRSALADTPSLAFGSALGKLVLNGTEGELKPLSLSGSAAPLLSYRAATLKPEV
jgi:hypothetical protein